MIKNLIACAVVGLIFVQPITTITTTTSEAYIPSETPIERKILKPIEDYPLHLPEILEEPPVVEEKVLKTPKVVIPSGEYPVATEIWNYLKNLGYNDYVCAGILGNMMAEVGGQTLDIQYWLYNPSGDYYGCCQWSMYYFPEIGGADLKTQLDFLRDTIKLNIDMFGNNYQQGFNYDKFLTLTDERAAALAFADCYERGAPQYNQSRINNATVAYNYFVK